MYFPSPLLLTACLLCVLSFAEAVEFPVMEIPCQAEAVSDQVVIEESNAAGLKVSIQPGDNAYPGVQLKPVSGDSLDASASSHLAATIHNTGKAPFTVHLRIDNPGDWRKSPWNVESLKIDPGETATIRTFFGYHNGFKKGFALDSSQVTAIQLFTGKVQETPIQFRIDSIVAAGTPGETPQLAEEALNSIRPEKGKLTEAGNPDLPSVKFSKNGDILQVQPEVGRWDLRQFNQITVSTDGNSAVELRAIDRGNRATRWMRSPLLFHQEETWQGHIGEDHKESHPVFDSRQVERIEIRGATSESEIVTIIAGVHSLQRPEWLGNRPPVAGNWKITFDEEFDSVSIDPLKWNISGPNYWGAKELTHWSRENVILKEGTAALRMEKKFGHHNDDPNEHTSDYTGGYLDTYDKWRQRYGYFETRVKFPTTDGLWPAFWLMPDAGREVGPMWKRQKTEPRGMEFDILEHLTGWGPYRYHIAMHWDGYGKNHKSTGTSGVYFSPDEDGFVTSGMLWEPGRAVFYVNGREVGRVESARISDLPGMIIFTLPIGGWDNRPINDGQLPADFVIDYVRVWQRDDLASDADGYFE